MHDIYVWDDDGQGVYALTSSVEAAREAIAEWCREEGMHDPPGPDDPLTLGWHVELPHSGDDDIVYRRVPEGTEGAIPIVRWNP